MLSLYMGHIDRNLAEVDNYLFDLSERNTDLLDLEYSAQENYNQYTTAKLRLYDTISKDIGHYKTMDSFFIYSAMNEELIVTPLPESSYEERTAVRSLIHGIVRENNGKYDNLTWYVSRGEKKHYVFHIVQIDNVYVGAWVNADKLMIPLNLINLGQSGAALLATDRLEPMNHEELVKKESIQLQLGPDPYYLAGTETKYLVMGERSTKGNFNLIAIIPDSAILEKLPYLKWMVSMISIGACLFLTLFLIFMRKVFLLPMNRIVSAMRKLKAGNWDVRLHHTPSSTEFDMMNETFNRMITEIHDLKINVYEEKLNHQQAELKHLQMQINPHFFLNSLNIIYNLATVKDYTVIQEMAKCLVNYFRFMYCSNSNFVTLQEELRHTRNYLRIQQLRFPSNLSYRIEAPDRLMEWPIPPLIIQTLVENSIKHAVSLDEPTEIDVYVELDSDSTFQYQRLHIIVQDTGAGFPDAVLEQLRRDADPPSHDGEHIGIWNVRRRLRLLYKQQASIQFSNEPGKGATVQIRLPLNP
ncbi:sensor histidine kinase [Paenibacillus sp. GCM10027629]|uniref:sensor histidine kinase n=1 Tax=Paenibacillus sp. GCM10027629 TaxID=3273414 RepID=UPI0036D27451